MFGFWLFVILLIALILVTPWWPHSRGWGYWPGGTLLTILVVWLVLVWMGWIVFSLPWGPPPA